MTTFFWAAVGAVAARAALNEHLVYNWRVIASHLSFPSTKVITFLSLDWHYTFAVYYTLPNGATACDAAGACCTYSKAVTNFILVTLPLFSTTLSLKGNERTQFHI